MVTPEISVIVPVYNAEKYLHECISSIINQSYKQFELILVDDCSSDSSLTVCQDFAAKDDRIKLIELENNSGPSIARNVAINSATGSYLAFIDADDWVPQNYLAVLHKKSKTHNCDIVVSRTDFVKGQRQIESRPHTPPNPQSDVVLNREQALINLFTSQTGIRHAPWGKLFKKSLFDSDIRFPENLLLEDLLTTYKVVDRTNRVLLTQETSYHYYLSPISTTRGKFQASSLNALPLVFEIKKNLDNPKGELSEAIQFCEYETTRFVINNMIKDGGYKHERRNLIEQLLKNSNSLLSNKYMTHKEKILIRLMRIPSIYELALSINSRIS